MVISHAINIWIWFNIHQIHTWLDQFAFFQLHNHTESYVPEVLLCASKSSMPKSQCAHMKSIHIWWWKQHHSNGSMNTFLSRWFILTTCLNHRSICWLRSRPIAHSFITDFDSISSALFLLAAQIDSIFSYFIAVEYCIECWYTNSDKCQEYQNNGGVDDKQRRR